MNTIRCWIREHKMSTRISEDECVELIRKAVSTNSEYEDSQESYTKIASMYDQVGKSCRGPELAVEELTSLMGERRDIQIMDLCAGTGLVGQHLHKHGFMDVDALDSNEEMLAEAKSKNVYRNVIHEQFGPGECSIPEGRYDAVTVIGAFVPNHINDSSFEEIIRISKPGGFMVFATSEVHMYHASLSMFDSHIKQLEDEGLWSLLRKRRVEAYVGIYDEWTGGSIYVLQKTMSV